MINVVMTSEYPADQLDNAEAEEFIGKQMLGMKDMIKKRVQEKKQLDDNAVTIQTLEQMIDEMNGRIKEVENSNEVMKEI